MGFDFGTRPSTPTPSTGAAKAAPSGFDFGASPETRQHYTPTQGAAAVEVPPRCNNCGAQMVRNPTAGLATHAPLPREFRCPKCGFQS